MSRRFEFYVPDAPPEMVAAERLEAIAADQERCAEAAERTADALERIAAAMEENNE